MACHFYISHICNKTKLFMNVSRFQTPPGSDSCIRLLYESGPYVADCEQGQQPNHYVAVINADTYSKSPRLFLHEHRKYHKLGTRTRNACKCVYQSLIN